MTPERREYGFLILLAVITLGSVLAAIQSTVTLP